MLFWSGRNRPELTGTAVANERHSITNKEICNNPGVLLHQIEQLVPEWKKEGIQSVMHLMRPARPKAAATSSRPSPPPTTAEESVWLPAPLGGREPPLIPRDGMARKAWEANLKAAERQDSWDFYPCAVCHQRKHNTKDCPTVICWICEGRHWGFECSAKVCSVCVKEKDHYEVCAPSRIRHHEYYCPRSRCTWCNEPGHHARQCGLCLWQAVECWNCGDKGHYSYECKKPSKMHSVWDRSEEGPSAKRPRIP